MMKNKRIPSLFCALWLLMLTLLTAPSSYADSNNSRLVSVDGNATEILLNLGLEEHIVAADLTSQPLLSQPVENLGYHRTLSAEGLLQLHPDLVIGSNHMGPAPTIAALKKAHIHVLQLDSPTTLEQLETNITLLASRLNAESAAQTLIEQLQIRQSALLEKQLAHKPTVVFLLDIGERGLSQAGSDTTGDALIKLLGGKNISQFSGYKSISVEALLAVNPDIILVGSRSDSLDSANKLVKRQPLLQHSQAAKNNQIVSVNAATLIAGLSLGALAEAERLADKLY
ncbi:heme/hemin ABC transporter substrate-binding protein [Methylophaga sp. UBA1918]|jgi:iron complex transport system substrate-binding protein|uniref:heme/hemin ABC transporter substrate-binding protein n=2 Tax=Methylophaga TaxID=40222 RepID=UPI00259D2A7D|nr:ABC transporter substrate-binding protein [Methylophaga sp. UBA1918]|tara:strand:- start:10646 stop:11500 length:855 start_codon:yes stop_codon:yes gene_type:complete